MSKHDDEVRGDRSTGNGHVGSGDMPDAWATENWATDNWATENWDSAALPTDLAAVQADEALIDALNSSTVPDDGSDAALARVLVAWRADVDAEPVTTLVDTDTALAIVARGRRAAPRRRPVLVPFAAAAAALVIAFSGVGLGAKAAEPGDRLWSVTKVLYTDHARSVEAAVAVRTQLQEASVALSEGRPEEAEAILARVQQDLAVVAEPEIRAELAAKRVDLQGRLGTRPVETGPDDEGPEAGSTLRTSTGAPDSSQQRPAPLPPPPDTADDGDDVPPVDTATPTEPVPPSTPPETGDDPGDGTGTGGEVEEPTPRSADPGGPDPGGPGSAVPQSTTG